MRTQPPHLLPIALVAFVFGGLCHAQQTPSTNIATLRAQSRIVVVDVVVNDARGQPVHDLKDSDFNIQEDRHPEKIRYFEEHVPKGQNIATSGAGRMKLPVNTFTNFVAAPRDAALTIILLDALNTPLEVQPFLRSNLKTLAETLPAGSPMAIFGLSNRLVMLQSFTADPAILKAALLQTNRSPTNAVLQAASTPEKLASMDAMTSSDDGGYEPAGYNPGSAIATFNRSVEKVQVEQQVRLTVDALTQLGRYLAALPGRKNLIWISGAFPMSFILDADSAQAGGRVFDNSVDFVSAVARVSAELSRNRISIFPVDPRGIQADPAYAASAQTGTPGQLDKDPNRISRASSTFASNLIQQNFTMNQFAENTGGHAFYGSNDIAGLVDKAIHFGSSFYTLTYLPSNGDWNGKERKIKIAVPGKNYKLSYRTSYIASEAASASGNSKPIEEINRNAALSIAATMQHGALNPSQIIFKLLVTPSVPIDLPAVGKDERRSLAPLYRQSQRRYRVDYAVDPQDIDWQSEEGRQTANIEFMIIAYDNKGKVLNKEDRIVPLRLTEKDFAAAKRGGIQLSQSIALPEKGTFYLRVGVLDRNTLHIGAIEVLTTALELPKS